MRVGRRQAKAVGAATIPTISRLHELIASQR
jgi:hypothetical protein